MRENKNLSENVIKLIRNKLFNAIEIFQKIYTCDLDKYTCKKLLEIHNNIDNNKEIKIGKNYHRQNSTQLLNSKYLEKEMIVSKDDIKKIESCNLSF